MTTVYMTRGLPASGKSTWAKRFVRDNPGTIRFNNDEFSYMTTGFDDGRSFEPMDVDYLSAMRRNAIGYAVLYRKDIILDNTNLSEYTEREVGPFLRSDDRIEIVVFDIPALECMNRNANRGVPIDNDVIKRMYERYHDHYDWMKWQ